MYINTFQYTPEDVDCKLCTQYAGKKRGCKAKGCPWMAERIEAGVVGQYRKYKLAAGKTAKSILISCGARMAPFDIKEVREMMEGDDLELELIGDRKTALFCIVSDTDMTFNFISVMVYTQMFNVLCDRALKTEAR